MFLNQRTSFSLSLLAASLLLLMTVWQGRSAEFPAITVTSATESETVGQ